MSEMLRQSNSQCSETSWHWNLSCCHRISANLVNLSNPCNLYSLNLRSTGTNYLAVLMRMMTNYLQIISFAASFNLGWPQSLKKLFDSVSILSQSAD